MDELTTFIIKTKTIEGYPVVMSGICDKNNKKESINKILELKKMKYCELKDVFFIDYKLAQQVKIISPSYIYALGVSIFIPNIDESTGGIIGSPHNDISSSDKEVEFLSNGLVLISMPGGPGFIIKGDEKTAKKIYKDSIRSDQSSISRALIILKNIIKYNIDLGIIITDGCGKNSLGSAITIENGEICIQTLKNI